MAGKKILLEARDLVKEFALEGGKKGKNVVHAVSGVNLRIYEGETLALVGESGCGKSTLGRLILRLLDSTEGEVYYKGDNILAYDKHKMRMMRQKMQIIFQDPYESLNPRASVGEIISEALIVNKLYRSKTELDDKIYELMETVGLAERLINSYPHELDGGRRQRIGIARALALNPEFIVCDEPVSALDVSIQAQILNLMQDLQEQMGLTYIFITHDLSVVNHFADDIAVMYLGQLIEKAPSELLFDKPTHPYTQALLSAIPVPSLKKKRERIILKGEITSPINPKPGCRFAARCPYATDRCRSEEPVLREIEPNHFVACHLTEGK